MREPGAEPTLPRLRAVSLVPDSRTESGSGAFLVIASDGNGYYIKAPGNPQGNHTLVAEVVAFGLGRLLRAPVCDGALIDIPASFSLEYSPGYRLHGGTGWGSKIIEPAFVSETWSEFRTKDNNRVRQGAEIALWDLCMGDDPQWLHDLRDDYSLWSFDHGLWLANESSWNLAQLRTSVSRGWTDLDPTGLDAAEIRATASRLEALVLADFRAVCHLVPVDWGIPDSDLNELAEILYLRAEGVADRLAVAAVLAEKSRR